MVYRDLQNSSRWQENIKELNYLQLKTVGEDPAGYKRLISRKEIQSAKY